MRTWSSWAMPSACGAQRAAGCSSRARRPFCFRSGALTCGRRTVIGEGTRYVLLRNCRRGNARRGRGAEGEEAVPPEQPQERAPTGKRPPRALRAFLPNLPQATVVALEESGKAPANSVLVKYARAEGEE